MRKFIWALMVAAAASMTLVACDPEENEPTEDPTPSEKCEVCGQDPCVCEDEPVDEVCPDCGKNPCECTTPEPTPSSWADYVFVTEYQVDETAGYGYTQFDMSALVTEDGKHVYDLLGYESWAEMAAAIGTLDQTLAEEGTVQVYGYDFGAESEYLEHNVGGCWGNWATATGMACLWGTKDDSDKVIAVVYNKVYPDDNGLMTTMCEIGLMPGCIFEGDSYRVALMFVNEDGVSVGVEVKVTVAAFVDPEAGKYPETPTPGTFDINFEETISLSALTYAYEGPSWEDEFELVKQKLGMTTYEFSNVGAPTTDDNGELYTGMTKTYTLADGTVGSGTNVWLNADSQKVDWGAADCVICMEWGYNATYMGASACVFPATEAFYTDAVAACVGKTFNVTYTITYIPDEDEDLIPDQEATVINMNFAITIAE